MLGLLNDITFAYPWAFWLLLVIPLLTAWYILKLPRSTGQVKISTLGYYRDVKSSAKEWLRHSMFVLRMLVITLLIVVLARPQSRSSWKDVLKEGIDIVLTLDISASMLAQDFKPNRLDASKEVALEFIDRRPNDRIGLVIFSGESFTQCPLTTDHSVLKNMFVSVKTGIIADGTAIGMGLATAVNRIKKSEAKSKVVILMTDGVNNAGSVAPLTAAEIAKAFGVRVYTIGVGTRGKALSPVAVYPNGLYQYDYVDVEIDEKMLTDIAEMTGGKYYRATDRKKLEEVYNDIDKLEKSIIEEKSFTNKAEHFLPFALAAGVLLALEVLLRYTAFRKLP
jgi:Ca-activated chloride channel homolog